MKTLKRDYVQVEPQSDATTVLRLIGGWIEGNNEGHQHSGPNWDSPGVFLKAKTEIA